MSNVATVQFTFDDIKVIYLNGDTQTITAPLYKEFREPTHLTVVFGNGGYTVTIPLVSVKTIHEGDILIYENKKGGQ